MRESAEDMGHRSDRRRHWPTPYPGAREGQSPINFHQSRTVPSELVKKTGPKCDPGRRY
jgi:hypothetical protein